MPDRYNTSDNIEAQYEPGSDETVLRNKLGISSTQEMDDVELRLLEQLYEKVLSEITADQAITTADIREWHRSWLGNIYGWAGRERSVNVAKADFHFAAASRIPRLLEELDSKYLSKLTPCEGFSENQLVDAIATVHVELILIHPFREGNGRLARLLAGVMALQAGWPELDFSSWDADKDKYFLSIQAGMGGDYKPMKTLVRQALRDGGEAAY